ncbi:hypothetical protein SEA_SUCHA_22 [Microbacterium phage Sucha]|nr:hypothetical protein SEA_SUCHA_22 [Microbacterium phage Sucha]
MAFTYRIDATSPSGRSGQSIVVRAANKDDALQGFQDATQGKMAHWDIKIQRLSPTEDLK